MRRGCLAAAALLGLARGGFAQALNDQGGRLALLLTPVAAFAPIATSTITHEVQKSPAFVLRYGYLAGQDLPKNDFGATITFPLALSSTISLTAGSAACVGCKTAGMFGIGADFRIYEQPFGVFNSDERVTISLNADGGWGQARTRFIDNGDAWSVAAGMPVALVTHARAGGNDKLRFVPWVTPGVGYGSMHIDEVDRTSKGTRFLLAGGLAVYTRGGTIAGNIGAQYLAWRDGDITFGVALVIGGK
ncbi:MAG TPA: hypothetical protein VIP11_20900 [Gemmatimonadaceae bacterium]